MWLTIANTGAESPKDDWVRDLYRRDFAAASAKDREMAAAMLDEHAKGPPLPSVISSTVVRTLQFLRPLGIPVMAEAPAAAPPPPSPAAPGD